VFLDVWLAGGYLRQISEDQTLCAVGHPFAAIGMGEHMRSTVKSLRSVGVWPVLRDIYGLARPSTDELFDAPSGINGGPCSINIFSINGDEIDQALAHLSYNSPWTGYNVVYPAWELARYPPEWARKLDWFDEIWGSSHFVYSALRSACSKPVVYMPQACEVRLSKFLGRRWFKVPERDYVFLFFFDLRSYVARKNPFAVVEAFRQVIRTKKFGAISLVLKVSGAEQEPAIYQKIVEATEEFGTRVVILKDIMTDTEVKNLVRCCDCFVSLHRSEGYGRGMAEAMFLGKAVIATGYSGNMDYMDRDVAFLVDYELSPLKAGEYPHWEGQVWAEADVDQAAEYMKMLVERPQLGRDIGERARLKIRQGFGYREIGMRYRKRIDQIRAELRAEVAASRPAESHVGEGQ
jgi:glycosyltransferase involved in cell wall biosynthesis